MSLIQNLNEEQQATLIQVGAKAMMDPWFGAMASIPLALNLVYIPHAAKLAVVMPALLHNYNNVLPRYTRWEDAFSSKSVVEYIKRCVSCHENAWEAFIAFAPAVLMCRMQKADGATVKELCYQFLRIRVLYTIFYLTGQWRIISVLRTLAWFAGMKVIGQLYMTALTA